MIEQLDGTVKELNKIVSFIETLQEVDVGGVEPMTSVLPATLRMRADIVKDGGYADNVLQNAPESGAVAVTRPIQRRRRATARRERSRRR